MSNNIKFFLDFYNKNLPILLSEELRPKKSFTRNIFSSVDKFIIYFKRTGKIRLQKTIIQNDILELKESGKTTLQDHIKNLTELKFLDSVGDDYTFTKNFIDFISSSRDLSSYIIEKLKNISEIHDFSMFLNYILATLRDGLINGHIILFPDSSYEFKSIVPDVNKRIEYCKKIEDFYGFTGSKSKPDYGDYTPNITYRIISTCQELNLVSKISRTNNNLKYFEITNLAKDILSNIGSNISKGSLEDDTDYEESILSLENSNNQQSKDHDKYIKIDLPKMQPNTYTANLVSPKRDPLVALNAKKNAHFMCEIDSDHKTFIAASSNNNYVEAHHLIPIGFQKKFIYSLDVEANIVSLCPNCHQSIHFAKQETKEILISKLYKSRFERLKSCNLYIDLKDLITLYLNSIK